MIFKDFDIFYDWKLQKVALKSVENAYFANSWKWDMYLLRLSRFVTLGNVLYCFVSTLISYPEYLHSSVFTTVTWLMFVLFTLLVYYKALTWVVNFVTVNFLSNEWCMFYTGWLDKYNSNEFNTIK